MRATSSGGLEFHIEDYVWPPRWKARSYCAA
jgi:hypothetical protein